MGVSATITQNLIDTTTHAAYNFINRGLFATFQLSSNESLVVYSQLWYAVGLVDQAYPIHFQLKANVGVTQLGSLLI